MIYINISDSSVEYIRTEKNILGREKIVDSGRKILAENLIKSGMIADFKNLISSLRELNLSLQEPKNNLVSAVISDESAVLRRFNLPVTSESQLQISILDEAKKVLKGDPANYENFYRIISRGDNQQILYAAIPISTVESYSQFFQTLGLKLVYLTTASFALTNLLSAPIIKSDSGLLYCYLASKKLYFTLFDKNGPIEYLISDGSSNLTGSSILKIKSKIETEKQITVGHLVLFGKNYLDVDIKSLTQELNLKIIRLDDIYSQDRMVRSIEFDSRGIPQVLFIHVLALYTCLRSSLTPNFALDIDKKSQIEYKELNDQEDKRVLTETIIEKSPAINIPSDEEDKLVEYKKTKINIMMPKLKFIIIPIILVLIIILGIILFSSQGKNFPIPFLSTPTLTPTPTPTPSLTPTPTIDPNLKRSDIKLAVQNGTQTTGLAKDVADSLEKLGYKNVGKSNADRDDYEQTVLRIKGEKKNYLQIILADLREKTENPTVEALTEDNNFDLIIILGKK